MDNSSSPSNTARSSSAEDHSRSWRIIRRLVVGLACLATLIGLFYAVENWRGKHAWEKFKKEWAAKGERFDVAAFVPKPVPPDQNFAMTPFLAPLLDYYYNSAKQPRWDTNALERSRSVSVSHKGNFPKLGTMESGNLTDWVEWQKFYRGNTSYPATPQPQEPARDVLYALSKFDSVMNELRAASLRPHAVFPVHYDEGYLMLMIPHLAPLKSLTIVTRLQTAAHLESGQREEALQDVKLGFRLAESVKSEPLIISHMVRIANLHISIQALWEGIAKQQWTETELEDLQKFLSAIQVLEDYGRVIRGERAFFNEFFDGYRAGKFRDVGAISDEDGGDPLSFLNLLKFAPRGWIYQNQLLMNRLHEQYSLPIIDAAKHRVYPELSRGFENWLAQAKATPYNVLGRRLFPALSSVAPKFARAQTTIDQAVAACALERYRIANGRYPEKLDALVPGFLDKVPADVINGEPLKYRRADDGQFVLYSVGWDRKDDGGVTAMRKGKTPRPNFEQGDWVWRYPAK